MPVMEPEIFFRAPYSSQRECGICGFKLSQWTSEAKFVAIRIGQVEEPLAPFGIAPCRVWSVAGRDHARIEGVDVGMVEDDTSPPRPISLRELCDEIEKAGSSPKTCKRGVITTVNDLKSQHAIEGDGARHVVAASVMALTLSIIAALLHSSYRALGCTMVTVHQSLQRKQAI